MKRTLSVARKETLHITRSRLTLTLVVILPLLLLIVMSLMFSIKIKDLPIAVMDYDRSPLSRSYVSALFSSSQVRLYCYAESYDDLEKLFLSDEVCAAVIIPPDFEKDVLRHTGAQLQIIGDGTEPLTPIYALRHISAFTQDFALRLMPAGSVEQPINLSIRAWYNPELRPIVGFIPGLIAIVMALPAVAVAAAVVKEREQGTVETLIATPLRGWELLLGKLLPYLAAGLLSVVLATILGVFGFQVPFSGNFLLFLLLALAFYVACFGIGLLISTLVRTQMVAMFLALLVFLFPGFFLSGFMYPISSMPTAMQIQANLFPTTHFVTISRGLFLKGLGLDILWPNLLILLGIGLVTIRLAIWRFRKRLA